MATLRQIQETLSQTSGAQYLYQPVIDRALFEATRKFTATRALFPRKKWNTPTYIFNKRTNFPVTRAVVEAPPTTGAGSVAATASSYSQTSWPVKHWQSNMDLAKFSIQIARVNGDLMQLELEAATESAMWWEEANNFYGSAAATSQTWRPAYDGVDLLTAANSTNKINVSGAPSFAMLDAMIDAVKKALGRKIDANQYAFVLSSELWSTIGRLFVQEKRFLDKAVIYPRDDRGQLNGTISDNRNYIDGGLEAATYRGVPFVESSFITSLGQMGTVTATGNTGSGSTMAASQYGYVVEAVSDYGVTLASAEVLITPTSTDNVVLSWTKPTVTDANGNTRQILFYRIFRTAAAGASGSETLYAVVAANQVTGTSDADVVAFTDTGLIQTPTATSQLAWATVAVAGNGTDAAPDGVTLPRLNTGGHTAQDLWLLPRDPDILLVPVVNELQTVPLALVNARTQQVALEGDQVLVVRGPAFMAKAMQVYVN